MAVPALCVSLLQQTAHDAHPLPLPPPLAARGAPGVNTALQLMAVPTYCVSLLQPHATLLFWISFMGSHLALQVGSGWSHQGVVAASHGGFPALHLPSN